MQTVFQQRFCDFRKEKDTLSFPITPLEIDALLLNMTAFTAVNQYTLELELADIADKDVWVSKFRSLRADLEDLARQKATLRQTTNGVTLKSFKNQTSSCSIRGMPYLTLT